MTQNNEVDIGELRQITSWLAAVGVEFIEISKPGTRVRLTLEQAACAADASATQQVVARAVSAAANAGGSNSAQSQTVSVSASSAGIFLTMHPARSTPLVEAGAQVKPGDIVGLLQIAQLCVPVTAPIDGVVTRTLAAHGTTVGYGTPLLELSPAA
ncbi:acetyl-CoA carboxylase biotin carboxyl carrier protein subunit [Paraburkholderia dipogonis]|uniref:Acetyl-CoA carboxylase biotin carboxyl carrier protein subunit n=1 Tax=Paraburkholderia dipogonis TaxID=1211383 RepID=A0A4Y8MSX4_9BURK|nr:acetyl-CoA carboxylase biotin carboxyl carrier protein subunit [Paraburkholderia dipogonis]TFE40640.1 acetyl-CoA carboxylase biotin carboxyl carrier protein subunit [Paraburkholderia dipogonis]